MGVPIQKFQDWFTQQWVILWGKKIDPEEVDWLMGPFGQVNGIGEEFIDQLAQKENLIVNRDTKSTGLIPSMEALNLPETEQTRLAPEVIDFYQNTANYELDFSVKWNPFFKVFGVLVNKLFSRRINQLNIPTHDIAEGTSIKSEIITLSDPETSEVKYTVWFRAIKSSGQVVYSGVYGTCILPNGKTCVKAVFPLPNGNATVIMNPSVGSQGELILDSSGRKFGDAGFYFLLNDTDGNYWSQFIRSFRDQLIVSAENNNITCNQTLTLWGIKVITFHYKIKNTEEL